MDTRSVFIGMGACLVLLAIGGLGFIYSGVYNVAADQEAGALKHWVLSTTMDRSVEIAQSDSYHHREGAHDHDGHGH